MNKTKIPKKIVDDLIESKDTIIEDSKIGENRGQLFVRIPKKIRNTLMIEQGDFIRFELKTELKKSQLNIEVIKNENKSN